MGEPTQTPIPGTDIDLFAIVDDTIFVFECKQSLTPTSAFDLRTVYNYILKAEKQLDKITHELHSEVTKKYLEDKYSIPFKNIKQIKCCILLSNRMFNGNIFKYPIRNIHEVENFLINGIMKTEDGSFSLWKGQTLTLNDLLEYFSLKSKLGELLYKMLSVKTKEYPFSEAFVEFDEYYLDPEKAIPMLKEFTDQLKKIE